MKKGFVVSFTCLTLLGVGWHANSITASTPDEIVIKQREQNSKAWLNWSGSTYLTAGQWCNVIGDNNLFKADVNVTNNGGKPGSIKVQILNNKGEIKGKPQTIKPGKTVTFAEIPANSGTFVVQAKAETSGTYTLKVTSR